MGHRQIGPNGGSRNLGGGPSGGNLLLDPKNHTLVNLKGNQNPNIVSVPVEDSGNILGSKNLIDPYTLSVKLKKILTKDVLDVGDKNVHSYDAGLGGCSCY